MDTMPGTIYVTRDGRASQQAKLPPVIAERRRLARQRDSRRLAWLVIVLVAVALGSAAYCLMR
ncbi:MAG: hypothetical protein V4569_06165 [Pseudomonadota bacterium]